MEMKKNQIFFHGTYSNLISLVAKYLNISMTFLVDIFQFHCKIKHKQVQRIKIEWDMSKSDSTFHIYKVLHYLNDF